VHLIASRTETIRSIGGPSKCGRNAAHRLSRNRLDPKTSRPTGTAKIDLASQEHQIIRNHHRREADVEGSTAHQVPPRPETKRLVGGPSKCGRKPGSSTWPKSTRPENQYAYWDGQNRLAPKSTKPTTANPRLQNWTSPVAPQRPRTVPTGRPPSRRPAQTRPNAGLTPVDGTATVHGRLRPAATSTDVAAAKPGWRHWPLLVAPWRLSTPRSGGRKARRPAQPRPGLHQPRQQPGKP